MSIRASVIIYVGLALIAHPAAADPIDKAQQLRLRQEGLYTGPIDGITGVNTMAALRDFGEKHSISDDLEAVIPLLFRTAREHRQDVTEGHIRAVESAFETRLRDSSSARIEFDFSYDAPFVGRAISNSKSTVVCGRVNAPNAYGGMTGFQHFNSLLTSLPDDKHLESITIFGSLAEALCYLGTHTSAELPAYGQ